MSTAPLDALILKLLQARRPGNTICPSEAARAADGGHWRELMPAVREAAAELDDAGQIEVLQRGQRVDARTARGPIRLRLVDAREGRSRDDGPPQ